MWKTLSTVHDELLRKLNADLNKRRDLYPRVENPVVDSAILPTAPSHARDSTQPQSRSQQHFLPNEKKNGRLILTPMKMKQTRIAKHCRQKNNAGDLT